MIPFIQEILKNGSLLSLRLEVQKGRDRQKVLVPPYLSRLEPRDSQ